MSATGNKIRDLHALLHKAAAAWEYMHKADARFRGFVCPKTCAVCKLIEGSKEAADVMLSDSVMDAAFDRTCEGLKALEESKS